MNNTLSQRWLMGMIAAAVLVMNIHASALGYIITGMGFLWIFIRRDETGTFTAPNRVTLLLFAAVLIDAAISLQWSPNMARGMYDLLIVLLLCWIALQSAAGVGAIAPEIANKLLKWFLAFYFFALLCLALDLCFGLPLQYAILPSAKYSDINLATIDRACFCTLLLLGPVFHDCWRRGWRIAALLLWLSVGVIMFFSVTAAGRLAFGLGTMVYIGALFWPRIMRVGFAAVLITGMIAAVPIAQVAQDILEKSTHHVNGSFGQRTEIWKFTAKRILEKPILGWGFDSSRAIPNMGETSKYLPPSEPIIPSHPHNWFLHVWLELGVVGVALITVLWLWLLYQTSKLDRALQPAAMAVWSVAIVIGAFSIGIWQSWWLSVLILAAIILQLYQRRFEAQL